MDTHHLGMDTHLGMDAHLGMDTHHLGMYCPVHCRVLTPYHTPQQRAESRQQRPWTVDHAAPRGGLDADWTTTVTVTVTVTITE